MFEGYNGLGAVLDYYARHSGVATDIELRK